MQRYELSLSDKSNCDIRCLDTCDDRDPYGKPYRYMQYGQQFHQANRNKYDICKRINP